MISLANQMAELVWLARTIAGLLVVGLAVGVPFAVRLFRRIGSIETRQARLERWQEEHGPRIERLETWQQQHGPPLERLALEQDAAEDPARAAALRHPQRGGRPDAPL